MHKRHFAMLALAGLASLGSAASAQQPQTATEGPEILVVRPLPPSRDRLMRAVYVGDLDLKIAAGQQEMEKRVGKAVEQMCAVPVPIPTYGEEMAKPCTDEAWASARPQMQQAVQKAGGGGS